MNWIFFWLPIDGDERKRSKQKYRCSTEQRAYDKAQFDRSSAITQVSPNRTGYAVGPVFQAEKDSDVKWRQVELKRKFVIF